MKTPFLILILVLASSLTFSGCSKLESLKKDVQQSTANVIQEAEKVKTNIEETKNNVDRKIQKVQNVVDAVSDLKKEL